MTMPMNACVPTTRGKRATKAWYAANITNCNGMFVVRMVSFAFAAGVRSMARRKRFAAKETGRIWLIHA